MPRWPRARRASPGLGSCQAAKTGEADGPGPGQSGDAMTPTQTSALLGTGQGPQCLSGNPHPHRRCAVDVGVSRARKASPELLRRQATSSPVSGHTALNVPDLES